MTSENDDPLTQPYAPPPGTPPSSPPPPPQYAPPPETLPPTPRPGWRPPQADHGRNGSLIAGVIILLVGLWFFASRTLGLRLPELDWGRLWPLILVGLGAWMILGAIRQRP